MLSYKVLLDTGIGKIVPLEGTTDWQNLSVSTLVNAYLLRFDHPSNFSIVSTTFEGFELPAETVLTNVFKGGIQVKLHTDEIHLMYSFTNAELSWEGLQECGQTDTLGEVIERKLWEDGFNGKYNVLRNVEVLEDGVDVPFPLTEVIWHGRTFHVELEAISPIRFELDFADGQVLGERCVDAPVLGLISDIATESFEDLLKKWEIQQICKIINTDGKEVLEKIPDDAKHLDTQTYRVFFVSNTANPPPPAKIRELNTATVAEMIEENNDKLLSQIHRQLADFVEKIGEKKAKNDEEDDKLEKMSAQIMCVKSMVGKMMNPKESAEYKKLGAQLGEVLRINADIELEQLKAMNKTQQNYIQHAEEKLEALKIAMEEKTKKVDALSEENDKLRNKLEADAEAEKMRSEHLEQLEKGLKAKTQDLQAANKVINDLWEEIEKSGKRSEEKDKNAQQNEAETEQNLAQGKGDADETDSTKPTVDFCHPEVVTDDLEVQKARLLEEIRTLKDEVSAHHMEELHLNLQLSNLNTKYAEAVEKNRELIRLLEEDDHILRSFRPDISPLTRRLGEICCEVQEMKKEQEELMTMKDQVGEEEKEEKKEEQEENKEEKEEKNEEKVEKKEEKVEKKEEKEEKDESSDPEDIEIVDEHFLDSDCQSTYSSAEE